MKCLISFGAFVGFAIHVCVAGNPDPNFDLSTLKTQVVVAASASWRPVVNEVEIEAGSALDFSTLCGSRELAGRWGRVVVRGAHFEFENRQGKPVRFYGVNLCSTANYLDPDVAERFVANLARMGYNALRLHHHDGGLVEGSRNSTIPNPTRFAQLDALVAACVKHGIYITTDLYVSRHMKFRELGIDLAGDAKGWPYKELLLFHDGAQSNYFAFARAFLGHKNPLTGRRYAEEPAIAWISLVNEGNHGHHGAGYFAQFPEGAAKWRKWLAEQKRRDPTNYGDIPDTLPQKTWKRDSKHAAAFSLFATDLEMEFDAKVKRFLREEMGCRALVSSLNGGRNPPCFQLARAASFDYVDDHFYFDHPVFIKHRWHLPSRSNNAVPFAFRDKKGCDLGVRGNVYRRLLDRPYTVTEFNYAGPNEHRGVGGLVAGSLAALQDWDGMWRFAWSHGDAGIATPDNVPCRTFDLCADMVNRASERAMMCLFLRGDMQALEKTFAWVVPEGRIRAVTEFSPYDPPDNSGAAWWLKIGSCVADAAPAGTFRSAMYDDLYRIGRADVVKGLRCGGGAVEVDGEARTFRVATSRTCGVFAQRGVVSAGVLSVDFGKDEGTVWVSSLDGRPLATSSKMLLTHLTDIKNTGMAYADTERTILLDRGRLPLLMRLAEAEISLRATNGNWRAYRLSPGGRRLGTLPLKMDGGSLVFKAATQAEGGVPVMCYELEIERAKAWVPRESSPISKIESRTKDPTREPGIFGDYWWANRFLSRYNEIEKVRGRSVDLVLLGDSIMHFWEWKHPQSWARLSNGRSVLNLGYGGDCTHNVIWRIEHGELDGYEAKCVVVMIGTNNNSSKHSKPERVAEAVKKIVCMVRKHQPGAKIVLHPIFPRGRSAQSERHADARRRNDRTNALLENFAKAEKGIVWIDFNSRFLDGTGWVPRSLMADEIHPTDAGYDIWMSALKPVL